MSDKPPKKPFPARGVKGVPVTDLVELARRKEAGRIASGNPAVVAQVLDMVEDGARYGRTLPGVVLGIAEYLPAQELLALAEQLTALAQKRRDEGNGQPGEGGPA